MAANLMSSAVRPVMFLTKLGWIDGSTVEDHPQGYPQLAAFANSDSNFLMCRRFGFLHNRVLFYRQDELSQLENRLLQMDKFDQKDNPEVLKSRMLDDNDDDPQFSRKVLIQKIDEKLRDYGCCLQSTSAILHV